MTKEWWRLSERKVKTQKRKPNKEGQYKRITEKQITKKFRGKQVMRRKKRKTIFGRMPRRFIA